MLYINMIVYDWIDMMTKLYVTYASICSNIELIWCVMSGYICSYVTILVEMKPVYRKLKWNQYTMITYASICFSIELIWYVMTELYGHM